ncbi:PDC sensor domain-containing protein [Cyclobacterium qasimii]|uniref:Cache sensor protein n=2 Tax=Cyclobacterium qasimii TaxID=1350429 RepID=S7X332_9BACT|nr:PDC sensor domain-containing protein [Cyclobacterium qasimii]EPR70538.1 Cache sensor protein [Cyclobacterium qasimii M12-11B]GEO22280.1 hypothetical protein CQA01_28140 [Cyclobacterium qasimii]
MKYLFFGVILIFLLSSSCQSDVNAPIDSHLLLLDSIIRIVEADLMPLEDDITKLAAFSTFLFEQEYNKSLSVQNFNTNKYVTLQNGFFYNPNPEREESTVFVSLSSENKDLSIKDVYLTERMDSVFKVIIDNRHLVSQVYFNSANRFTRLFPSNDLNTIDPYIDLTSFNFFYLGDALRNPTRKSVWVEEVYVDPMGKGWMLSLIQPVYYKDELKGVLGFDITISDLMRRFLNNSYKKLIIIDGQGSIVAGGEEAIKALNMPPLKNHTYIQTVNSDSFRKEDFNLYKSKSKEIRKMASKFLLEKVNYQSFELQGKLFEAYSRKMDVMGWYLLDIHDE